MQTFMTSDTGDFKEVAKCLDNLRLNKQALEGWQIMLTLLELDPQGNHRVPRGWSNHPAVNMWRNYEPALYIYVVTMVDEWKKRGYKSTIADKATETMKIAYSTARLPDFAMPPWLQDPEITKKVASSHRLALLSKNYEHYSQFDWREDNGTRPTAYEYQWV